MKDYKERDTYKRSIKFAVEIAHLVDALPNKISARAIGQQLIRSATSISINIAEGSAGVSKKDFINFMAISRKSAVETEHWLNFLKELDLLNNSKLAEECVEMIKILTTIINKTKSNES